MATDGIETQPEAQTEIGRGLFAIAGALNRLADLANAFVDANGVARVVVEASLSTDGGDPLPLCLKQDDEAFPVKLKQGYE